VEYDVAIAGGGPAGLTAALVAARHGRRTVVVDPLGSGGALLNQERIEGFPGFPEGVPGYELGPRLQEQALEAGAVFEPGEARTVQRRGDDWTVATDSGEIVAGAVVVATGARPRELGVPGEDRFQGKGLSHCASCDGPLFQGGVVAVCGSGDHALAEALELVRHDVRVVLLCADEALGGQETYRRRIAESAQVEIKHQTVVEEILGDGKVEGVRVRDVARGLSSELPVAGLFTYVGLVPNSELLDGIVALDELGHVPTDMWMRTEVPGLFAAGDVRAGAAGQAISAAGDGATAGVAADRYLAERAQPTG
jgi:thioredoxin reductase (NADPH)